MPLVSTGDHVTDNGIAHMGRTASRYDIKVYDPEGEEAQEIAKHIPSFPFKGLPKFYDIQGFLAKPAIFKRIVDIFVDRYRDMDVDAIAGIDARGFILGPPIALQLKKPFYMMRKKGKMPNTVQSPPYKTEYGERSGVCIQRDAITSGQRVVIIDDLVATGGTLSAGIALVQMLGGVVVECACVVELTDFVDPPEGSPIPSRAKLYKELGIDHVPIWALISDKILDVEAKLPEGYVDDGEEH